MNVPLVHHTFYLSDIGPHVFPTEKYRLIMEVLERKFPDLESFIHQPESATPDQVAQVHTPEYIRDLIGCVHTRRTQPSELPISKEIIDAYFRMTGGSCLAAELAVKHGAAMNVGGGFHHAFADRAEGFCYINDVAVAIRDVQAKHNDTLKRFAVIDTDLHQGNGTAHIFQDDPSVFTFSIHQENNYPIKEKSDLDVGLPDFTGDTEYLRILENALDTVFSSVKPQFIIYVAGVDPFEEDQLGSIKLTREGMKQRDQLVFRFCRENQTRVATVLAGGYAKNVADTAFLHVNTYIAMTETWNDSN